ncbi:hypothetical protein GCM10010967_21090 [Dyadobacter beijingensis]|uniref:Por secretion system C-terminal sorting domain-containing protein n=1 Tax=Dyadobacter beijingensis TaxID=365489 RepID=A0ABQ2HS02_9BACT|nr:hypothetical protein GCM10010967_21090 [Dyadobacter beijingensis]
MFSDKITLEFENPATLAVMPARVELYHEKSAKPIHLVVIRDVNDVQGLREGNKLDLDVSGLPRGTYYLHVWRPDQSKEVVGKLKFILE